LSREVSSEEGKTYKCKYCGATFNELWKLGNHVKYDCEEAKKAKESVKEKLGEEKETPREEPPKDEKELEPRQLVAQFGRDGLNQIKRERLKRVLDLAPGVGGKVIPFILHKWDVNARVRDDPMALYNMLHTEGGLKPNIAQSITVDVFSVEAEFADLLYQRGEAPIFYTPPGYGVQQPTFMGGYAQPFQPYPPQVFSQPGQPPQYPLFQQPQPDLRSVIREELKPVDDRLRRLEEPKQEAEGFVEIEEPVRDSAGNVILGVDDKPIVKRMKVPASQAGQFAPKEDVEAKILAKMEHYKKIFGSELTESKIREIVRQEMPTQPAAQPEPITPEDVKKAASEAAEAAVKQVKEEHEKEKKDDERFKHLEDTIRATASAKTVEGYKEDSYRILGQGLTEVASATKDRKPIEVIVREGGPLLLGAPPPKQVEKGAEEGLVERFQKRGWITEG
jgi:hypothetical protein